MPIELRDVRHRYKRQTALDAVSLHVRDGDVYGFIGHNGAGKTTALRALLGLLRPKRGSARIDGHDPIRTPRIRAVVGGLIEHPGFHEHRSGQQNLTMFAGLRGLRGTAGRAEVLRVLDLVGLSDVGKKRVSHYSQGMKQRLGLALALLGQPRFLILDEPTNGLDPQGIHELRELLAKIAQESGVTILLSSHLLTEVAGLCTRIGVLHEGHLLTESTTADLLGGPQPFEMIADAGTLTWLREHGVTVRGQGERVLVDLGDRDAAELLEQVIAAGNRVRAFAPTSTSLEQIYLQFTRGDRRGHTAIEPSSAPPGPVPELSRLGAVRRVTRYESSRLRRPATLFALCIPALLAPLVVYQRFLGLSLASGELDDGTLATTTGVTAFDALGRALLGGVPVLALIVAGLASQSLAGEWRGGTLRNLVMGPFHRSEVAVGKLLVLLAATLGGYTLLLASAATAAGYAFDYGDLVEIIATSPEPFPLLEAKLVWPELWPALAAPVLPLLAFAGLGFLCGAVTRSGTGALALTLGTITGCELIRALARAWHAESGLLGPYIPSPFSRGSHLDYFVEIADGVSRQAMEFAFVTPLIWLSTCAALAAMILKRRYVP